jgi:hypothetical protein
MTVGLYRRAGVLLKGAIVLLVGACASSDTDEPGPKWYCVVASDGCSCSQLRPGKSPKPGAMWEDRCPAAPCCLLNTQSDETTLANCGCLAEIDDCPARAMETQTMIVASCPPP